MVKCSPRGFSLAMMMGNVIKSPASCSDICCLVIRQGASCSHMYSHVVLVKIYRCPAGWLQTLGFELAEEQQPLQ